MLLYLRPAAGDERGFIHRKGSFLRRIGKKVLGGVPIIGGVATAIGEAAGVFEQPQPVFGRRRPRAVAVTRAPLPLVNVSRGCPPGFTRTPAGGCVQIRSRVDGFASQEEPTSIRGTGVGEEQQLLPVGVAKMGRFGAGLKPAVFSQQVRRCPRGSILGAPEADGTSLCYNRRDISNKERAWPRGRRPLLTGGEMRAVSIASRAAKKLQSKQKQLQELGLLKKPAARSKPPSRASLPPGTPRVLQIQQE